MEPRRNDPCPCGSGKKYKNCCMIKPQSTSVDRVFSYTNYRLIYGFTPFYSNGDWQKFKEKDGIEVTPSKTYQGDDLLYHTQTPWGHYMVPETATRIRGNNDINIREYSYEDFDKLIQKIGYHRRIDYSTWPYEFHTIAFVTNEQYAQAGFCLVSTTNQVDRFIIRSELYPVSKEICHDFLSFLYREHIIWPVGKLNLELSQDVFTFHVDILEKYLSLKFGSEQIYTYMSKEELSDYLLKATDESQYYPNPSINPDTIKFRNLAVKYRTHCRLLMEQICDDESLHTTLYAIKNRQWLQQLLKIQSVDIDEDINPAAWVSFEKQIDRIIEDMKKTSGKNIREANISYVEKTYPHLSPAAKDFLATAETLYELNKNIAIDFAPIAVEYGKVLETQLRIIVKNDSGFEDMRTMGELLRNLQNPYTHYIKEMRIVYNIRNQSAHSAVLTIEDIEEIRDIFYKKDLLNKLQT